MKTLGAQPLATGLTITPIQFYHHFINSLPAEYDMIITLSPLPIAFVNALP
jgi:hypothetical protein